MSSQRRKWDRVAQDKALFKALDKSRNRHLVGRLRKVLRVRRSPVGGTTAELECGHQKYLSRSDRKIIFGAKSPESRVVFCYRCAQEQPKQGGVCGPDTNCV